VVALYRQALGDDRLCIRRLDKKQGARDTVRDLRGEQQRLPLRVRVTTSPLIDDCWSVNISEAGIGLTARADPATGEPRCGTVLEMDFHLPNGDPVSVRGRVTWVTPSASGPQPGCALGVEFEPLAEASREALALYLRGNRVRVGVAFAAHEEAAMLGRLLAGHGTLFFVDSAEKAQTLATRGNVAVMLVCGDEASASALVEWIGSRLDARDEESNGFGRVPRPRVLFCAPISAERLLDFFNAGWIYRWMPPPLVPGALRDAVDGACADFAWHAEREHIALALASERRTPGRPRGAPTEERVPGESMLHGATMLPDVELPPRAHPLARVPKSNGVAVLPPVEATFTLPMVSDTGRYEDPRPIAEGGMGVVVGYTDNRLGRQVALKTLQEQYADRSDLVAMLAREARITGSLEHPNIIPVYDAGRTADGLPFYVMKLVDAPTLDDLLKRTEGLDDAMSEHNLRRLLRVYIQVCQAVDFAHSRGVIHCDLKPANVLLGDFGQVLVVDWGLAYVAEERTVCRGGTLGYLSPEQMGPGGEIDSRTDVYALGSILYEVLCLRCPFDDDAYRTPEGIRHPGALPVPPSRMVVRSPIPEELEEICLRAMAVKPQDRYPTAGALAIAVEAFLEGTKERERRQQRADDLVKSAMDLATNYFELVGSRPDRVAAVEGLRAAVAPWEPPERKRELWDAEDSLAVTDTLAVRTLQAAVSTYEQALDEVREHAEARQGLVRLYASELKRAEQRRDERDRTYFEGLVSQYDDGSFARASSGSGSLSVECQGGEAEVELSRMEEQSRRLVALGSKALGRTPLRDIPLALGSYLATVTAPGLTPVRFPIVVKGGDRLRLYVDLGALASQPADEVLVPAGPAILGGDEGAPGGGQMREVPVASFFIQERQVSFREYLTFLTQVIKKLGDAGMALAPRHGQRGPFWTWNGETFTAAEMSQWGDDTERLLDVPVFGVDLRCAEAYAKWKSRETGHRYRLPTEEEWEKAARGTDGRLYPWGNHFDASFCCMRESSPGAPRPRPRALYDADMSPFGIRDMAGGVADWVTPAAGTVRKGMREIVSRGGAWCDWRTDCLLTGHRPYVMGERSARVGFRLVREGPSSVRYVLGS
jgi:eukaryotic-like serine/threonine-protein kinase